MIKLGQKVRDRMTGFTGIAEARTEYLNGCLQILVRPKKKPKEIDYPTGTYIDVEFLDIIDSKPIKLNKRVVKKAKPSGGIRLH